MLLTSPGAALMNQIGSSALMTFSKSMVDMRGGNEMYRPTLFRSSKIIGSGSGNLLGTDQADSRTWDCNAQIDLFCRALYVLIK